jgi:hypothetical protein
MAVCRVQDFMENLRGRWAYTAGLNHSSFLRRNEWAFEMYAEQVRSADVPANVFGCQGKMLVLLPGLKYGCGEKARGSKAGTGLGYGFQTFNSGIEYIAAAGTLNMNVDEARGDYFALRIEYVIADNGGFDLANLGDDAIFNENGRGLFILRSVEQSAIGYEKFL